MRGSLATYGQKWQVRMTWKGSRYESKPANGRARRQMRITQSRCSQDLGITVSDNKNVVTWKRQKIKLMYFVYDVCVCLCVCISSIMCGQQSYREYKEEKLFWKPKGYSIL